MPHFLHNTNVHAEILGVHLLMKSRLYSGRTSALLGGGCRVCSANLLNRIEAIQHLLLVVDGQDDTLMGSSKPDNCGPPSHHRWFW